MRWLLLLLLLLEVLLLLLLLGKRKMGLRQLMVSTVIFYALLFFGSVATRTRIIGCTASTNHGLAASTVASTGSYNAVFRRVVAVTRQTNVLIAGPANNACGPGTVGGS
uniref:Uncharacterized protein n=1 Tax=Anopheles darlingi TaxID=43151 RepID=A0A2M4D9F4_ANODA